MLKSPSIFTSPAGEARYMAAYEAMFALWPVSHESLDVPTRFGKTHINVCGSEDSPPLVLLHAAGLSSTAWFANIGALSRAHRTYAIDIIGDAGKSKADRLLENRADYDTWLLDVFDALGIERAHLLGHSQGGWLALGMALTYPQRLNKLVLLAPAASILSFGLLTKLMLRLAGRMIRPSARSVLRVQGAKGAEFNETFVNMMEMVTQHCLPTTLVPTEYSADELKQITMPTLLLIGDQEKIYNPTAAIERAKRFIPHIEADIVPNAGHTLNMEQPDIVNIHILSYLDV